MTKSDQPFAGIRVVEFGQFIAVPYASQLLADGGAEVIKVEPLEGDPSRHLGPIAPGETRHFVLRNRGKRSLPLDLRRPESGAILDALLSRADVVLTNLRPGLARELGLDYASLAAAHPRLIVGNVTAFGEKGPDAGLPGMDLVVQARSGLLASNGRLREGLPVPSDSPAVDYMCAVLLSFGISTALFRRERTGRGGEVDVSLLMAALVLQNNLMVRVAGVDGEPHHEVRSWLATARESGVPYAEQAARQPTTRTSAMTSIYYRTYTTKDAAIAIACVSPGLQRRLLTVLELEDDAKAKGITDRQQLAEHYSALQVHAEALLASKTTAEWKAAFGAAGIPASEVRFPLEMLDDPQVTANGYVFDQEHAVLGPVRLLSSPVTIDKGGFQPAAPVAPLGSESHEILADLGFDRATVEELLASGVVGVSA
jgi:crotonobetainyl-CoA:carnitine CoA-transferase CaiB-like acyl-CoA transferase